MSRLKQFFKPSVTVPVAVLPDYKALDAAYVEGSQTERAACVAILDRLIDGVGMMP